jgi:cephalosporin hydroxylase
MDANEIDDAWHGRYYDAEVWKRTTYLGIPIYKLPLDMWRYQELIWERKPDLIIETGTYCGASALFMAHVMDRIGNGRIVTIDISLKNDLPSHDRVTYVRGSSSTDNEVVARARSMAASAGGVMVILDSDHKEAHVSLELEKYAPWYRGVSCS